MGPGPVVSLIIQPAIVRVESWIPFSQTALNVVLRHLPLVGPKIPIKRRDNLLDHFKSSPKKQEASNVEELCVVNT
jgi:hypothetical protein